MIDLSDYTAVFPTDGRNPYQANDVREIENFRKKFDGVLFIDRVLQALGIAQGGKPYPPRGDKGVRNLYEEVCKSKVSPHHKLSVFYYLLLDFDYLRGNHSQLADALAEESGLPQKYQTLMRGLWHMDHEEFRYALEHLAHPSLPSEFADEIIIALVKRSAGDDYSLPLSYFHAQQPVLKTSEGLNALFAALAYTSVTDALTFSRRYPEPAQQQLFQKLVASILERPERGKELVSSPLSGAEERWLQEYLTVGDGRKSKNARQIAQMRQVVTGRNRGPAALDGLMSQV